MNEKRQLDVKRIMDKLKEFDEVLAAEDFERFGSIVIHYTGNDYSHSIELHLGCAE